MLDDYALCTYYEKSLVMFLNQHQPPPPPVFATNEELFNEFYRENFLLMMNLLIYGYMGWDGRICVIVECCDVIDGILDGKLT
jgi:hypothetical protein